MKRFVLLTLLGLLQLFGVMVGSKALQGIGAALGASPRPKVFAMADGLETFSSRFFLESENSCIEVTPELTGALKGPYNRRNVFGALLAYGPVLQSSPEFRPLYEAVARYAFPVISDELGVSVDSVRVVPKQPCDHLDLLLKP